MGTGLRGVESLTLQESSVLEKCEKIYVDAYTSVFPAEFTESLIEKFQKRVIPLQRETLESMSFLDGNKGDFALLVSGDPFGSTTHFTLLNECRNREISIKIYENASILGIIPGRTGLSAYRTGSTVSIPDFGDTHIPPSPYIKIQENISSGLHTLILIDLNDGKNVKSQRILQILEHIREKHSLEDILNRPCFSIEKAGWPGERTRIGSMHDLLSENLESPYCLVIPGKVDHNELSNILLLFPDSKNLWK
jgi:diphthine synthase